MDVRLYCKGAPEMVLDRCSWELGPGGERRPLNLARITAFLASCQRQGQR